VLMLHELRESPVLLPIEQDGVRALLGRVREECDKPPSTEAGCGEAARRLANGVCITLAKRNVADRVLAYWSPVPAGHGAAQWLAAWRAGFRTPQQRLDAGAVVALAPAARPAGAAGPGASGAAAAGAAAADGGAPGDPVASAIRTACGAGGADGAPLQLYTQVYDESSRQAARPLRRALQGAAGEALLVGPVEDVNRSATLRGTRRPVPWPQPTFLLHSPAERACAESLRPLVQSAWTMPERAQVEVWIRQLPTDQAARERVLELWLPRRDSPLRGDDPG